MANQVHTPTSFITAAPTAARETAGFRGAALAAELLRSLFQHYPGSIALRLWTGENLSVGSAPAVEHPRYTLVFKNPDAVYSAVLGRDPLRFAESYFRGDIDLEGDFFAALGIKDHLDGLKLSPVERLQVMFAALKLRRMNRALRARAAASPAHGGEVRSHSRDENRAAIRFHYDVSNEFYALWLDRAMVYSCAYFRHEDDDLDTAQTNKLDHICRKLLLKPGELLLDIGCGWGALVMHAARHYGVRAHGVTLSANQLRIAEQRIAAAGLADRVRVELKDYRDLEGQNVFDKVASVGMFEHVGIDNLPAYFGTVHRLLKPHGLFMNHGITHEPEGSSMSLSTEFINRYVFPDGQLDTVSNVQGVMERMQFEIADVEALRPHYARTLRRWVERLERQHAAALAHVSEATYRVWRLYMAASALQFEAGDIGIYQILASKRALGPARLPMTRAHLYS